VGDRIPLFQLHSLLLPHTDLGLHVFEDRYRALVTDSLNDGFVFGVALIRTGAEVAGPATPHDIGTLAYIAGYARLPDGRYLLEVEGTRRFRIRGVHVNGSYPSAAVEWLPEPIGNFAFAREASAEVESLAYLYRSLGGDGDLPIKLSVDPVARSYQVASLLRIDTYEKQTLLECGSAADRLDAEIAILKREITLLDHIRSGQR
jgi:hypothetical protein